MIFFFGLFKEQEEEELLIDNKIKLCLNFIHHEKDDYFVGGGGSFRAGEYFHAVANKESQNLHINNYFILYTFNIYLSDKKQFSFDFNEIKKKIYEYIQHEVTHFFQARKAVERSYSKNVQNFIDNLKINNKWTEKDEEETRSLLTNREIEAYSKEFVKLYIKEKKDRKIKMLFDRWLHFYLTRGSNKPFDMPTGYFLIFYQEILKFVQANYPTIKLSKRINNE
jgi:hypothetical protein